MVTHENRILSQPHASNEERKETTKRNGDDRGGGTMIYADEIRSRDSQMELSRAALEAAPVCLKANVVAADLTRSIRPSELNLSGSQVLVGVSVFWTAGFLIWALLKLWLFEQ